MIEAWQQSLSEARQIAKMVLGWAASAVVAERNSGIYRANRQGRPPLLVGIYRAPHFSINGRN